MTRTFTDEFATRGETPLLVGIVGPSGTGKTFSALRLAVGVQRVSGGDIGVIDTEAGRAKHYASRFRFRHLDFTAPFSPLDYLAAFEHYYKKGVKTIVVDSQSHEHEGKGGVLEWHQAELDRLAGGDLDKRSAMQFSAWGAPKQARRALLNAVVQMKCNFIFCFRAKDKLKLVKGGKPVQLGWMPIAGEEFVYEMTIKFLLLPGSNGIPVWRSEFDGERAIMKLADQFRPMFSQPKQLCEEHGEQLARWASGGEAPKATPIDVLVERFAGCADRGTLVTLQGEMKALWDSIPKGAERTRMTNAFRAAESRVKSLEAATNQPPSFASDEGDDDDDGPPVSEDERAASARDPQERRAAG
ncbi:MAG TPA: AAA family ATPase [Kofleriaceae bacterium]|jgi:hypothetical protein